MDAIPEDILDRDLPEMRLDKDLIREQAKRYRIGSVRVSLGRVRTGEEFEEDKKRILSCPLP
ncbi:MAG: hypothetical protein ACXQT2_03060 [Methanotrichaceae archaeon]